MTSATNRIVLKSPREIGLMRDAGRVVHRILTDLGGRIQPGVTTAELNRRAEELIAEAGAVSPFKGYRIQTARTAFPASICASVNCEIVHGIPNDRPLRSGDVVSIDCGIRLKGYCGDSAMTFAVGEVSPQVRRLLEVTQEALSLALQEIRPGVRWSRIARKIQRYVESNGLGVVRNYVGHGIGQTMHESPSVPNYVEATDRSDDFELVEGMTIAVEPMVTLGSPETDYADRDKWVVITKDRQPAAHFEHTIAVMADGVDVLTGGG